MVDKLRVVHPTDTQCRVDDALFIHHCDGCPGYSLFITVDKLRVVHRTPEYRWSVGWMTLFSSTVAVVVRATRCFCLSLFRPQIAQTTHSLNPVRRPSGGALERGVWHGCQTRHVGPWMARLADPRNSAGARGVERSETRMPGALSLWLLSLLREQRESDSA